MCMNELELFFADSANVHMYQKMLLPAKYLPESLVVFAFKIDWFAILPSADFTILVQNRFYFKKQYLSSVTSFSFHKNEKKKKKKKKKNYSYLFYCSLSPELDVNEKVVRNKSITILKKIGKSIKKTNYDGIISKWSC